jgi:hypothetical protein
MAFSAETRFPSTTLIPFSCVGFSYHVCLAIEYSFRRADEPLVGMPCREDIMKRLVWKLHLELQPRLSSNLVVLTLIVLILVVPILPILNLIVLVLVLTVVPNSFETNSAPDGIVTNIESIEEGITSKQLVGILEVVQVDRALRTGTSLSCPSSVRVETILAAHRGQRGPR